MNIDTSDQLKIIIKFKNIVMKNVLQHFDIFIFVCLFIIMLILII